MADGQFDFAEAPFRITVYDRDMVRTGWLGDPIQLQVTPRHLQIGSAEITVDLDHIMLPELTDPGARVVIEHDGEIVLSGPIVSDGGQGPTVSGTYTLSVEDDARSVWMMTGFPSPTQPIETQPTVNDVRSGPAETVLKGYVNANRGRWATTRPIVVSPDLGRGSTIDLSIRMLPLSDKVIPALEGTGIGFTVRQDGTNLRLDCFTTQLFPLKLTEAGGTVTNYSWTRTHPTATRAIIGGPNSGTSREFKQVIDSGREALYRDVIETVVDGSSEEIAAKILAVGTAALAESGPTYSYTIELAESDVFRYGGTSGIHVGDRVQVELNAGIPPIVDVVREASLNWTRDDGYTTTLTIGAEPDSPDKVIANILEQLARGIRDLQTR